MGATVPAASRNEEVVATEEVPAGPVTRGLADVPYVGHLPTSADPKRTDIAILAAIGAVTSTGPKDAQGDGVPAPILAALRAQTAVRHATSVGGHLTGSGLPWTAAARHVRSGPWPTRRA